MRKNVPKIFAEIFRHHISLMLFFTVVNGISVFLPSEYSVCFSVLLPTEILSYSETGDFAPFKICCVFAALICTALFVICIVESYKKEGWLICAAVMTVLDAIFAVCLAALRDDMTYFADFAVHIYLTAAIILAYFLIVREKRRSESEKSRIDVPE